MLPQKVRIQLNQLPITMTCSLIHLLSSLKSLSQGLLLGKHLLLHHFYVSELDYISNSQSEKESYL